MLQTKSHNESRKILCDPRYKDAGLVDLQEYPGNLSLIKVWWIPTFSWLEKCCILIIFQLLLMSRKCASHYCRETETKIKQIKKNMEISFILDQSLVNRTLPSLNGGYLEIKLTVPLFVLYLCLVVFLN